MKRQSYFFHYPLSLIALGVMLLLSSCKQLGLVNNPPTVEEIPAPGSIDPGLELVSDYLICPTVPSTAPLIPPGPYDEELGDCALRGKSAEIEAWLTALEGIAASCLANREPNWADTLAVRSTLDMKVDEIPVFDFAPIRIEEFEEEQEESDSSTPTPSLYLDKIDIRADSSCPIYESSESNPSSYGDYPESSHIYTSRLKRIGEDVEKYCTMIDEIIKPLWQACDEINFYQDCQEPNHEQYHAIIESMMNAAQINYDYTDFFYSHTLQTLGWGNFREAFSETSIDCPLDSFAPDTKFTFSENAFCRRGPSLQYQKVSTFLALQEVQIVGRNEGDLRWWRVSIPETSEHCWVSDSTGSAAGLLEELEIVVPPPPVSSPICSSDLSESACTAAGGTWAGKDTPTPYCDCP